MSFSWPIYAAMDSRVGVDKSIPAVVKVFGYNATNGLGSPASLRIYDKYILPISKFIDCMGGKYLIGKNIVICAKVAK